MKTVQIEGHWSRCFSQCAHISPSWCPRPRVVNRPRWRLQCSSSFIPVSPAGGSHWPRCFSSDSDNVISCLMLTSLLFLTAQQAREVKLPCVRDHVCHEMKKTSPGSNVSCRHKVTIVGLVSWVAMFILAPHYCVQLLLSQKSISLAGEDVLLLYETLLWKSFKLLLQLWTDW